MGVDAKWGRFPTCPEMSRFVPFVLFCPSWGQNGDKSGQKRINGDKTGHLGTNWETPPFSIHPHLALLKEFADSAGTEYPRLFQGFSFSLEPDYSTCTVLENSRQLR